MSCGVSDGCCQSSTLGRGTWVGAAPHQQLCPGQFQHLPVPACLPATVCLLSIARYLSALLLALSTMLHLELPQVNVLSKVDLVPQYGQLGGCGVGCVVCWLGAPTVQQWWLGELAVCSSCYVGLRTPVLSHRSATLSILCLLCLLRLPPPPSPHLTAFNLEYYTQVQDLSYLVASMGRGPFSQRFRRLSAGLADVIEGYSLVGFTPLAIQVKEGGRSRERLQLCAGHCVHSAAAGHYVVFWVGSPHACPMPCCCWW